MVGRPVDRERRTALLDAAVDHATEHGFADLSWRTLAAALGVSSTTLVHHFGSKEELLAAVLGRLRDRMTLAVGDAPDLAAAARAVWTQSSDPARRPTFRLFFAVLGQALQSPDSYVGFLEVVGVEWTDALRRAQGPHTDPDDAARRATLVVATLRGLLLDLLAGGDEARVRAAAEAYLATLGVPAAREQ